MSDWKMKIFNILYQIYKCNIKMQITIQEIELYRKNGLLIIKNFFNKEEIEEVQEGIYKIIGHVMRRHNIKDEREKFTPDRFDIHYLELLRMSRSYASEIYDLVKHIPAFQRLYASKKIFELIQLIKNNDCDIGIATGGCGIRIDNPREEKFKTYWHQEYPAQLRSIDGIVIWSPLVPITNELGPVNFCPGSHKNGALKVYEDSGLMKNKTGAYSLRLYEEEKILKDYPYISPLLNPGDIAVVDYLLVHSSGDNISNRSRWSMQLRYFNFLNEIGQKIGWTGSYAAGIKFSDIHPDLLIQNSKYS